MNNRKKITAEQLIYLTEDCRELINNFISENNYSKNKASILFKVHPAQLSLFINKDQGFNMKTMQRIGEVIAQDHNSKQ